jgi:hypothetical protein
MIATFLPERAHCQSLVAKQRKLSGDGIQYPAQTRRLAPFRFTLKADGTGRERVPAHQS